MSSRITHLLYLHGFRSGPQSTKARQTGAWIAQHHPEVVWRVPQLPASPRDAIDQIQATTADWPDATSGVVGSSLGGFYATVMAERRGWRAALLNPAVDPARDLARHIGPTTTWHGDAPFFFGPEFIAELEALRLATSNSLGRTLALIAKGDEVLDWRETSARYAGARIDLIEGNDHALSDYADRIDSVMAFFGLGHRPPPRAVA